MDFDISQDARVMGLGDKMGALDNDYKGETIVKIALIKYKKRDASRHLVNRCTVAGASPATIPKLSSFWLVVLLVDDKF